MCNVGWLLCQDKLQPIAACAAGNLTGWGREGSLVSLQRLFLRNTGLTGTLPSMNLPAMHWLDLSIHQGPDYRCQQPRAGLTGKLLLSWFMLLCDWSSHSDAMCKHGHLPSSWQSRSACQPERSVRFRCCPCLRRIIAGGSGHADDSVLRGLSQKYGVPPRLSQCA